MSLSVVIVTYRSDRCIEGALASVRAQLPEAEIVVVDNASDDATRTIVRSFGGVRLVEQEENLGFGRACNIGADNSTGTHLLFVNPDARIVSVDSEGLHRLLGDRPCGLVGPFFVSSDARPESPRGGLRPEQHWLFAYFSQTFGVLRPRELPPGAPHAGRRGAHWLAASVVLAEREEFDRMGRFDPRFFLYFEDRELSARYHDAGLPIRSTPAIRVKHLGGGSSHTRSFHADPQGWALLGWIQYLHLRHGPGVAGRAAWLTLVTLRSLALGLRVARIARVPRVERKWREVGMLLDFIDDVTGGLPEPPRGFCPDAVGHLARLSRFPHRGFRSSNRSH